MRQTTQFSPVRIAALLWIFCLCIIQTGCSSLITAKENSTADLIIVFNDENGSIGRTNAPASSKIELPVNLLKIAEAGSLSLTELTSDGLRSEYIAAQFVSDFSKSNTGKIWWLMPSGEKGERRFYLTAGDDKAKPAMTINYDKKNKLLSILDDNKPVLRYNHGSTPEPSAIAKTRNESDDYVKHCRYSHPLHGPDGFARGDYIHPLYGLNGEVLTDDYPADHPHHRGINWAWATVFWQGQQRDMFALRGIWSRPVSVAKTKNGPVVAIIEAENQWKWDNKESIVSEHIVIRAFRQSQQYRYIDIEITLKALVDNVEFCGRMGKGGRVSKGYSGFNLRMASAEGQQIVLPGDVPETDVRRGWADYSANFTDDGIRTGVAVLQHKNNPLYPSKWYGNKKINYFQPLYPGPKPVSLPKDKIITLKYRLCIHRDSVSEDVMSDLWTAYNADSGTYINKERECAN